MQLIVFFSEAYFKRYIFNTDGILKSLSLLKSMSDLTHSITPSFLYVISSLVVNGGTLGKDSSNCFRAIHKLSIFLPTIYLNHQT